MFWWFIPAHKNPTNQRHACIGFALGFERQAPLQTTLKQWVQLGPSPKSSIMVQWWGENGGPQIYPWSKLIKHMTSHMTWLSSLACTGSKRVWFCIKSSRHSKKSGDLIWGRNWDHFHWWLPSTLRASEWSWLPKQDHLPVSKFKKYLEPFIIIKMDI